MKISSYMKTGLLLSGLLSAMLFGSCADGYDSPNGFDSGVNNETLTTPDSLTFKLNAEGTEATISWPLVLGADCYQVTMMNITDPENPTYMDVTVGGVPMPCNELTVDGCSMTVPVTEDSKYSFLFKVIGNVDRGNKDGQDVDTVFMTMVPSILTIPASKDSLVDISNYLDSTFLDSAYVDQEVAIELEAGGRYKMTQPMDFQFMNMTFRGNKAKPAFIDMEGGACFYTYSGLKIKHMRFDMTNSTANGLVQMSNHNLPDTIKSEKFGFTRSGSLIKGIYNIIDPIFFQNVWCKNMPRALVNDNSVGCAWWNLTIKDCIMQVANEKSSVGFICFEKKGALIKNITISNSTIYNIYNNSGAYFLRFFNQSNSNPQKVYGNTNTAKWTAGELTNWNFTMSHVTLSKIYSGQKWANNVNGTGFFLAFDHCIFYDLYQPFRRIMEKGYSNASMKFNFFCNPDDESDTDYKRTDSSGAPCAAYYNFGFLGDCTQELDLEAENGGVDFTPDENEVKNNKGGDSRWIE